MAYLWEMHAHMREVSGCSQLRAADAVEALIGFGYDGVVTTDHFTPDFVRLYGTWDEAAHHFFDGYRAAAQAARGRIAVLPGMELRLADSGNDYLIYGITEAFLAAHDGLTDLPLERVCQALHQNGILIYQAHPFRFNMRISDPAHLDGVEVFNSNDPRNTAALAWAERYDLLAVSGSDLHRLEQLGTGGILTTRAIQTPADLVRELKTSPRLVYSPPIRESRSETGG